MDVATSFALALSLLMLIGLLFMLMFSYYALLKRIKHDYYKYYQKLGSPFLPSANQSVIKTIRRDDRNYVLLGKILTGLPTGFPENAYLRQLAYIIRIELLAVIVVIAVIIGILLTA